MLGRNGALFLALQFGSRFANSFLTTAARYELLETQGVAEFAGAQFASNVMRMVVSQVSGILADNFSLKRMYVASEGCNLLLAGLLLAAAGRMHGSILFMANVTLGLIFAFSQPLTKAMPPAVVAQPEGLAILNAWDLTCDKVARYLAPMVYAVVSSTAGFRAALMLSVFVYAALTLLRTFVRVADRPAQGQTTAVQGGNGLKEVIAERLFGLLRQIWDGFMSLRRDHVLGMLIVNTLVTNLLVYPLSSVVFPVLFKRVAEKQGQTESQTLLGGLLASVMRLLRIKKKKEWMNYSALVSLGGVVGPILSNFLVYVLESYSKTRGKSRIWVGLTFGVAGQILSSLLLAGAVFISTDLEPALLVLLLVLAWVVTIAVNNIVTTYFNSLSQQRLGRGERGKYYANIMTVFTLGNSLGTLLFGWTLSLDSGAVVACVQLLLVGIALKVGVLIFMQRGRSIRLAMEQHHEKNG